MKKWQLMPFKTWRIADFCSAKKVLRAFVSTLLAVPHGADILRAGFLVYPNVGQKNKRKNDSREPKNKLGAGIMKDGRFGEWLREDQRLGDFSRTILGDAVAGLDLRKIPKKLISSVASRT